jgi:RHS repeat-associated protein
MLCAAKEEISLWPMMGESVLSLAADLLAADPAFLKTRIPEKSQLAENSRQGFESTNRRSHPEKIAAKSTTALGVSCFLRSGTAVGSGVVYDGDGNRVAETAADVTTKYLVDTLNPTGYSQVLDELVSGAVTKTYTYGRQRISENQLSGSTWTPTFYGYDGHGNVRFTTNTAGTVGNTYQFDAFGMPIASTGTIVNTYLYSGERFDSNLNLYQLRARYYNQATGRFEAMDSELGKIFNPSTLHKYIYTQDNPVNATDPTGKDLVENVEIESATIDFSNHGLIHLAKVGALESQAEIEALIDALVRQFIAELHASGGSVGNLFDLMFTSPLLQNVPWAARVFVIV